MVPGPEYGKADPNSNDCRHQDQRDPLQLPHRASNAPQSDMVPIARHATFGLLSRPLS
jgi:hypothetical protein